MQFESLFQEENNNLIRKIFNFILLLFLISRFHQKWKDLTICT